ncbi:MAG: ATP synthase F1 subunit epsilon [Micavibrio sp.]|nr:ATP synthase F1 subunit epsilon [Micavibrio sp.]MAF98969.1 ATP synthase F1 subunit epsilon [Micavibrio sp.]|tara:strand:- start:561881 stop:562297 length:417 start_codon:yes stop_codon:yes gene_type:complete
MSDTANNTFHFELVSPAKKLIEEPAFQVVLPGEAGDVGVRKGHASLVVSARPGVVEILREQGGTPERLFIAGGFADITAEQTTLLAEEAIPVSELDGDILATEQETLIKLMTETDDMIEKKRISDQLVIVTAKLKAVA